MMEDCAINSVICLGTDWYSPTKSSTSQVIDRFYRLGMKILWINPVPVRFPSTRRPDFWQKVQSKARTHVRFLNAPQNCFYVFSPLYIPAFSANMMRLNRLLITAQVIGLRRILKMSSPLIFFSTYTAWYVLPILKRNPSVFHFADKLSAFRETSATKERRQTLDRMETELIEAADLVTCSSHAIYQHARQQVCDQAGKVIYLPHGVPASQFRSILEDHVEMPADLKDIPKPVAGYFGSLTEANDKSTFAYAAQHCPDWSFVFIGAVGGDYTALSRFPNVFFLGQKPYEEIPAYGKFFDVCFMGWQPHEWITNCSPVKALEYLALGKPVVCSCEIKELETYAPYVRVTQTPEEYVAALREAYMQNTPDRVKARLNYASQYSWDLHVQTILNAFEKMDR